MLLLKLLCLEQHMLDRQDLQLLLLRLLRLRLHLRL